MTNNKTLMLRGAIVAFTAAVATMPATNVAAQNVTLDFNTQTETVAGAGTRFITNCYMESGFVITAVGVPCTGSDASNAFLAVGPNSPLFGGGSTPSLVLNTPSASEIDLMRSNGGVFGLNSIGLSGFFGAEMTSVMFSGMGIGGSVMQTFTVGAAMQTYALSNAFSAVTSVRITAMNEFDEPLVNIDDIQLAVASVPEPASLALMLAGMVAMTLVSRRRRHA